MFKWLAEVDIGIRPRQVFEGADVDFFPFTQLGIDWLTRNIADFVDPIWAPEERCLKLSQVDSTDNLLNIIRTLQDAGLRIRCYGRLKGLNNDIPKRRSKKPPSVIVSAITQIILFAEPMWRAIKMESLVSIVGTSLLVTIGCFLVLQATVYRERWARDGLASLAILSFCWAIVSGALFATDHPDLRLAAATSIPNLIAIAVLYTPTANRWFNKDGSNNATKPR